MYFVYLLECNDGTIYTGITTNVVRRFEEHKKGIGSRYTRAKHAVKILYTEQFKTRSEALKREAVIKSLSRIEKIALTNKNPSK